MEELFEKIRRYVDEHHDDMLALWEEMVNTESGSRQLEGVTTMQNIIRRELEAIGAKVRVLPVENAGGVLVAEWNSDSPKAPLLFIGHVDTVFKEGAVAANPFRIDENGFAHGPGVLDMKGGLTIAVFALKALAAAGFAGRPIKCVFAGDEENLHMLSNAKQVMMEEVKGAAAAFNFETGFMDNRFVVGRKGGGPVSLTVHGVSAHSGNAPEKGRSAVLEAAHKIVALEACNDIPRGKLINCGKITGGIGENTIPDLCTINIGVRFPSTEIKNEILDALEDLDDLPGGEAAQLVHAASRAEGGVHAVDVKGQIGQAGAHPLPDAADGLGDADLLKLAHGDDLDAQVLGHLAAGLLQEEGALMRTSSACPSSPGRSPGGSRAMSSCPAPPRTTWTWTRPRKSWPME